MQYTELSVGNKLSNIKRLVLDVLKPHQPNIIVLSQRLSMLKGVFGASCTLAEIDQETESIKITIEGNSIEYEEVKRVIEEIGGNIHSIDGVIAGKSHKT